MEPQTPRTHPSFWRSPGGVATAIGLGAAAIGIAVVAMEKSPAAAAPPTAAAAAVPGHWYIFEVTSASDPTVALQQTGFASVEAVADPLIPGNYTATGKWTGQSSGTSTSVVAPTGLVIGALTDNGFVQPPTASVWAADDGTGTNTTSLAVGTWYMFSVRTSFLSSANLAGAAVAAVLVNAGWKGALVTAAADTSTTPDTWNVYAQWNGASTTTTDAPPVWVLIPQHFTPTGATAPVLAHGPIGMGTTTPTAAPGTTMP